LGSGKGGARPYRTPPQNEDRPLAIAAGQFPSAVDAVKCAVAVQEELRKADETVPHEACLQFRIGVHVGDVMVRGGDLLGRCNQHSGASSIASGTRCGLPVWCHLGELADAYAPAPVDRKDPLISPLFADFSGFPADARLIQVGSAETLLDDASRLAAAMRPSSTTTHHSAAVIRASLTPAFPGDLP
jgi:hypothetical protein